MKKFFITFCFIVTLFVSALPFSVHAASLSIAPSSGTQSVGKNFTVTISTNTSGQPMNASSGVISFPPNLLEVVSVSKTGSIFSLWVQEPTYSNANGTINFEGVVLNPGFTGSSGKLLSVTFRPKAEGTAVVKFNSGAVLANDGFGTNLASTFNSATFTIGAGAPVPPPQEFSGVAPKITSSTHENQDAWYNKTTAVFDWNLPSNVLETRILIGRNEKNTPTVSYVPPISTKTIESLGEGTYYFAVQHRTSEGWGQIGRFKINIDTRTPLPFDIAVDTEGPEPRISFETEDQDSGLSHYEILVEGREPIRVEDASVELFEFSEDIRGAQTVRVIAYDRAGNQIESSVNLMFSSPLLEKPRIEVYPTQVVQGELLAIEGTATPNIPLELIVRKKNNDVLSVRGTANADGTFEFSVLSSLSLGYHTILVRAYDAEETMSIDSAVVPTKIVPTPLIAFALTFISYLGVAILVLVGVASFVKILMYFVHDFRQTMRFLKHPREASSKKHGEVRSPLKQNSSRKTF